MGKNDIEQVKVLCEALYLCKELIELLESKHVDLQQVIHLVAPELLVSELLPLDEL